MSPTKIVAKMENAQKDYVSVLLGDLAGNVIMVSRITFTFN